ncbi:MAG: Signal recognition particle GTPase FtsY [Candidatus Methanohalarchaeum thermophilum]|uniref:Signal recognition particle receptor FtsY n=1 Tax=Methanohalarchaeum thermophilum TaxID=1903181 RepID=A0A1Q6DXW7_METT1|nr:MAG: Signal recognition particle GTPase FtsY [Candidatus Methanohalarchaeum thermophilum]
MFDNLKKKINIFESKVKEKTQEKASEEKEDKEKTQEQKQEQEQEQERASLGQKAKKFVTERKVFLDEDDVEPYLEELKLSLLKSDVALEVSEKIVEKLESNLVGEEIKWRENSEKYVKKAFKEALIDVFPSEFNFFDFIEEKDKPINILFVGTNGVGKTTTIAKISKALEEKGYSSVLANGDTFRAGAIQQLDKHGENIDKKVIKHEKGGDPAAVIYDAVEYSEANNVDVVLGDTAGRMHTDVNLMDQIKKIKRVTKPDLIVFVDEAVAGSDAVERAKEFDEAVDVDAVILSKIDADVKGGAAISISHTIEKPIIFVGTGQGYEDIKEFNTDWFVGQILE